MSEEEQKDSLKELLNELGLATLIKELKTQPSALKRWKKVSSEQWVLLYGLAGVSIYNHLNGDDEEMLSNASSDSSSKRPDPKRLKRWKKLNRILDRNKHSKKRKRADHEDDVSTPYSKTTWGSIGHIFESEKEAYNQPIFPIPLEKYNFLSQYLSIVMKCYGYSLVSGNEAKRLHLIAPVIMLVVSVLTDVVVQVEEDLNGEYVHANGHFEFILVRGIKRICIIEAKEEKFKQGMAQNLLGCEVAADLNGSDVVYGIVTNFDKWIFIESRNDVIKTDEGNTIGFDVDGRPLEMDLLQVVGKIHSILQ